MKLNRNWLLGAGWGIGTAGFVSTLVVGPLPVGLPEIFVGLLLSFIALRLEK